MKRFIITRLELVNYLRMAPAIYRFVYTPDETYTLQTILGTNGCGKSSLQNELWPLPPSQDDFGLNGKKDMELDFDGRHYQLISTFEGNKPRHEFIVDGQDLNDGGKIEMFRALCEEHFGVTAEIRALALAKEILSKMTPSRRRYWMVKLADSDFTYAMERYNKLKEHHRDAQGAIKRLQKRLVDETNKLVDKEVVEMMARETVDIKTLITELYGMRNPKATKPADVVAELQSIEQMVNGYCDDVDRINTETLTTSGFKDRDDMVTYRDRTKRDIHSTQQLSQHLFEDHNRIKKKYDVLIKAGTETIEALEAKRKEAMERVAYEETFIVLQNVKPEGDPQQLKDALMSVYHELFEKISALPSNDGYYSSKKAEEYENRVLELTAQINPLRARISRLTEDMEHKRNHLHQDMLTCPQCSHTWSTKASEKDIANYEAAIVEKKKVLQELEEKLEKVRAYLAEMSEYSQAYRAIIMTIRSVPILSPYFNTITQNNRLVQYPSSVASEMYSVQSDIDHHIAIYGQKKLIAQLSEQIELKKNLSADTLESIEAEMLRLETAMGEQTRRTGELQASLNDVERLISRYDMVSKLNRELDAAGAIVTTKTREYIHSRYQELLWHLIMSLQTSLARKEDALMQANNQQAIVDDIKGQIDESVMNERIAKAAHQALSPTNGAIAEGLNRSVNGFIGRMNKIVNSIWTYPLDILPLTMEDGQVDMDYRFPFRKHKEGKPAKDISEGSESMIKVFDFAFRLAALRKMGLDYLPLFLDEFESPFDDVHRERAIYFVKKLVDERAFNQIFMVSHYESNHGALGSLAQTCVLNKDNLMLPTNIAYNEHVVIN